MIGRHQDRDLWLYAIHAVGAVLMALAVAYASIH